MAYSTRRSAGRSPPNSQDEDSSDDQTSSVTEVCFNEASGLDGFLIRDTSSVVRLHPSSETDLSDQSRFRFKVVVDYGWETQYIPGRLLATHIGNKFVAYTVKVNNVGAVRIIDLDTKERVLMKVDKGYVKDVEFMHKAEDIYIGFVDEYGTFYINKIHKDTQTGGLSCHSVFKVSLDGPAKKSEFRRFIWCKFVPDELSEVASIKDCAYQFAVLLDDMIYAGNLVQMVNNRDEGAYTVNELRDDLIIIDTHSGPVTDASFAPDGTALATASKDGTVKFFQIYFQDKDRNPPRCLYSWEPHEGRPIDRLMFLDNHSIRPSAESQYWKFMITCTENMTEMKLFTCKTWRCLQTIHFTETGRWKMEIDITAHYLLATDITKKAIYLLHFDHDDETARVDWIRELSLPFNVLSFNLATASRLRMKDIRTKGYSEFVSGDPDEYKPDTEMVYLETNMVHPKSLQQGIIAIDPPQVFSRSNGHHISFQPHVSYQEVGKDIDLDEPALADDEEDEDDILSAAVANKSATQLSHPVPGILDTDDGQVLTSLSSLNNIKKKTSISPMLELSGTPQSAPSVAQMSEQLSSLIGISPSSIRPPSSGHGGTSTQRVRTPMTPSPVRQVTSGVEDFMIPREINTTTNGNISKASSSSSPSREVEEILSPKNTEMIHRNDTALDGLLSMKAPSIESIENGNLPHLISGKPENHFPTTMHKQKSTTPIADSIVAGQVAEHVTSMVDMMNLQATEMQDLKREVGRLHGAVKQSDDVQTLRKVVEAYFKDNQIRMNRLEETLKSIETQERLKVTQSANNNQLPANLAELLAVSIGNVVKKEIEGVVPTTMERLYEPSRLGVNAQLDKMTAAIEAKLTQNIAHIFQRDKIWDSITNNFKTITKAVFEQTFNEIFTNTVFPRCQNAVREMLSQVNETFMKGTKEYLSGLEEVLERERKKENMPETIRVHFNSMQDALSSALQVEVEAQMLRVISGLQGTVVRQLEDSLSRELTHAFQEQKKYFEISVIPRTVTPAVSMTDHHGAAAVITDPIQMQRTLLSIAKSGDIVQAFVQACNYGDLQVLMFLCKNMNPTKVFESKLPHQTHVSILQQMATDIQNDTDTKLSYLNTAIGSLDTNDRKTLQSVTRVLPVFQSSVAKYVAQHPDSKLIPSIKLLEMALLGLSQQVNSPHIQGMSTPSMGSQHSFGQY